MLPQKEWTLEQAATVIKLIPNTTPQIPKATTSNSSKPYMTKKHTRPDHKSETLNTQQCPRKRIDWTLEQAATVTKMNSKNNLNPYGDNK